jgi:hypothetical protein
LLDYSKKFIGRNRCSESTTEKEIIGRGMNGLDNVTRTGHLKRMTLLINTSRKPLSSVNECLLHQQQHEKENTVLITEEQI